MLAIDLEQLDIVKALINAGANLYDSTYFEDTPLGLAMRKGDLKIVKLLLLAGADPNYSGESPPIYSAIRSKQKHVELVQTLINFNADVDAVVPMALRL